jgi:hypothetical protein
MPSPAAPDLQATVGTARRRSGLTAKIGILLRSACSNPSASSRGGSAIIDRVGNRVIIHAAAGLKRIVGDDRPVGIGSSGQTARIGRDRPIQTGQWLNAALRSSLARHAPGTEFQPEWLSTGRSSGKPTNERGDTCEGLRFRSEFAPRQIRRPSISRASARSRTNTRRPRRISRHERSVVVVACGHVGLEWGRRTAMRLFTGSRRRERPRRRDPCPPPYCLRRRRSMRTHRHKANGERTATASTGRRLAMPCCRWRGNTTCRNRSSHSIAPHK